MKYLFAFLVLFVACQPAPEQHHLGFVPIPTGTGFVRVTSGKFDTSATTAVGLTTQVTGTLPISNGGTGAASLSSGVLQSNGSVVSSSTVDLASQISGILPVANGGTGNSTFTGVLKNALFWSPALYAAKSTSAHAGNNTFGGGFRFMTSVTITGMNYYCDWGVSTKSVKYRIYDETSTTLLTSGTQSSISAGAHSVTGLSISVTDISHTIAFAVWLTDGSNYCYQTPAIETNQPGGAFPIIIGPNITYIRNYFAAGDANPTTTDTSVYSATEPTFTVP